MYRASVIMWSHLWSSPVFHNRRTVFECEQWLWEKICSYTLGLLYKAYMWGRVAQGKKKTKKNRAALKREILHLKRCRGQRGRRELMLPPQTICTWRRSSVLSEAAGQKQEERERETQPHLLKWNWKISLRHLSPSHLISDTNSQLTNSSVKSHNTHLRCVARSCNGVLRAMAALSTPVEVKLFESVGVGKRAALDHCGGWAETLKKKKGIQTHTYTSILFV